MSIGDTFAQDASQHHKDQQRGWFEQEIEDKQRNDHEEHHIDPMVKSFTVQHEQERPIHQCGTRIVLEHDDGHRQTDNGKDSQQIPPIAQVERIGAHIPRQSQRGGKFHKFGWLQCHRSDHNPRAGTVNLLPHKKHHQQNQDGEPIEREGQHVVIFCIDQQD